MNQRTVRRWQTTMLSLMALALTVSFAVGQTVEVLPEPRQAVTGESRLTVLVADRREQLQFRLSQLENAESSYGERHPSLEMIRSQMVEVQREMQLLSTWQESLEDLSQRDLGELVLQLAIRVEQLEDQVAGLQQRSSQSGVGGQGRRGRRRPPRF